jgi:ferric enterobactin receptor
MKPMGIILLLLTLVGIGGTAQPTKADGQIVAKVFGAPNQPLLDGATAQLWLLADSGRVWRTATAQNGYVEFLNLRLGLYRLSVSHVGYATHTVDSIELRVDRFEVDLGDLRLSPGADGIRTVVVLAKKQLFENSDGKLTYNVGESAQSSGSSTADLLRNMPMTSTDPSGNLLLKGKPPRILIDDKPVELTGQQLNDLLEGLGAANIERVELMQNPPPQFAGEPGGVINIVTKKGSTGLTGKATVGAGTRGEGNGSLNLSYRHAAINFGASLSSGFGQVQGRSWSERTNFFADSSNQLHTASTSRNAYMRPGLRIQLDVQPNPQHQWSVVLQANGNGFNNRSVSNFGSLNRHDLLWRISRRSNHTTGNSWQWNPQVSYRWRAKNPQHFLQIIAAMSWGSYQNHRDFYQQFLDPFTSRPLADSAQNQQTNNGQHSHSLRVTYNLPLGAKVWALTAGASTAQNHYHNALNTFLVNKLTGEQTLWPLLSNATRFVQTVSTARLGLVLNAKGGWRSSAQLQTPSSNRYLSLLPSATIRKDLSQRTNLSFVYRKSLRRPAMSELNPAVDYNDPYNLRFGNPLLAPSSAHNFDFTFVFNQGKHYLNASLGYNRVGNIINTIRTLQPDGKTLVTFQNVATKHEYEAAVFGGYAFAKIFRVNASAGITYNQYADADRKKFGYRNGITSYLSTNYNIIIASAFTVDGSCKFSRFADAQGSARSNLAMSLGAQYKFFDRRLVVAVNAVDPFLPQRQRSLVAAPNFLLENFTQNRTKNYRLVLGWVLRPKSKPAGSKPGK